MAAAKLEMSASFKEVSQALAAAKLGMSASFQVQLQAAVTPILEKHARDDNLVGELEQKMDRELAMLETKLSAGGGTGGGRWCTHDPRMRGATKFAGDKEEVKVFTDWKRAANNYLDKFSPKLSALLRRCERARWPLADPSAGLSEDEVFQVGVAECGMDKDTQKEEVEKALYSFLTEHLTDTAAEIVEPGGANAFEMWRLLHEFYEPITDATVGTVYAAVCAMAGKKAKDTATAYALLLEFDKRLARLTKVGGKITIEVKASILYNMLDDSAQKAARDTGITGDYERLRLRIIRDGCEHREKAALKAGNIDGMEERTCENSDLHNAPEGGLDAFGRKINPDIVCYICKEKGHPSFMCPKNQGGGKAAWGEKGGSQCSTPKAPEKG